ncbi:MAG: TonB-dependent receptor [Tannerella sp.]|jgi:TonB-linked SusC/RagA family outer membrane protein|nr:TonB-dependent receptor [Tannerella sp.]
MGGGGKSLVIKLVEDAKVLEEVVVVGYGTQKKVNLTGAVSSLSGEELSGLPATNMGSMLQGKLPGVAVTSSSGQPGREGTSMLIRGVGTMNNSAPMVLVDGLEASMDDVNPNDVENISVLKDAAAAAIYGTRAANGVILVTTKRGKQGKPALTYNGYVGWERAIQLPDHLSSAEYAELSNEARLNEGNNIIYTPEDIAKYRNGSDPDNFPNTDWVGLFLRGSGLTHNHNISLSGGTEATRYLVSLAYYNQEGLTKNTAHDRYTVRVNLDSNVTRWLSFGINSSLSYRTIIQPTSPYGGYSEFFRQVNRIPNTFVNKYQDGTWGRHIDGNPIAWIEAGGNAKSNYTHALGSAFGEIKIIDGLTLKGVAGLDYNFDDGKTHIKEVAYGDGSIQGPNSVEDYLARWMTVTLQGLLNYEKQIGDHHVKGLLGVSRESYTYHLTKAYRRTFPSNELTELDAGSSNGWTNNGSASDTRIGSYFGRLNYDYAGKYLFEFNLRSDGSSKFARGRRWGTFPSLSAAWRISEERFMEDIEWLDNLKLRGSWGKLGNHRTSDYLYIAKIALGQNYNFFNGVVDGAAQTGANNALISWETTTETNLGMDVDIRNGLLTASAEYYDRYTDNILTTVPVSLIFGLDAPVSNGGALRNRGVEISLGHAHTIQAFRYSVSGYVTHNKNTVEKYPNPSKGNTIRMEGYPWDSFYGYECTGIFMTDEEAANSPVHTVNVKAGDLKFKDQNGDGKIDADDRVALGNSIPNITYGFSANLKYGNVDLQANFQGVADAYRTLDAQSMWPFENGSNPQYKHLDRTLVENGRVTQTGYYPRTLVSQTQNRAMSSFLVINASYLRLKHLQLGYNLPKNLLDHLGIARTRVYFSGQNLLTFKKMPVDVDPENGNTNVHPQIAIYTVGLDITF